MYSGGVARPVALVALALLFATVADTRAATSLSSMMVSPDVSANLGGGVLVHDEDVAEDQALLPPGMVTLVGPVGLPANVDLTAFHMYADGTQLFSVDTAITLPGIGLVSPADVVETAGAGYAFAFQGAAAGVPDGIAVDAVTAEVLGLGQQLLLSFDGSFGTFDDEDLVRWDGATLTLEVDLGAAGIAPGLDLDAADLLPNGHYLFSFDGSGQVTSLAGAVNFDDEDVLEYDPLLGTWEMAYDASTRDADWQAADLDALAAAIVAIPPPPIQTPTPTPAPTSTRTPAAATPTPTTTPTAQTPTPTAEPTPTGTPTVAVPTPTGTPTGPLPTATQTATVAATVTSTHTPTALVVPTATPSSTPTTAASTPTPTPTATVMPPTATPSRTPTVPTAARCMGKAVTISGSKSHDVIQGTAGDDVIDGGGGSDIIRGGAGNDTICGGDAHDVLSGEAGDDVIVGGDADDDCLGGPGDDTFSECENVVPD